MLINPTNLDRELKLAGIKTGGCNSNGIVWAEDGTTEIQDRPDVKAVMARHNPTPVSIETLDEKIERIVSEKLAKMKGQL